MEATVSDPKPEILQIGPYDSPSGDQALEDLFVVHRWWEQRDKTTFLARIGPRIRGIAGCPYPWRLNAEFLQSFPNLEIITIFGIGHDSVDMEAAARRGVVVANAQGAPAEVADCAMGLLLACAREIVAAQQFVREGRWSEGRYRLTSSLAGRRVGVLGLGQIGKAIAKRCAAFDMEVGYHGRRRQAGVNYPYYESLQDMAQNSDVLMIAAPQSPETEGLVNAEVLAALGARGIVINVGRGSIVHEPALVDALRNKTILAAGLDVTANEPYVTAELLRLENALVLPHTGGATDRGWTRLCNQVVDNLRSWFAGQGAVSPIANPHFGTGTAQGPTA